MDSDKTFKTKGEFINAVIGEYGKLMGDVNPAVPALRDFLIECSPEEKENRYAAMLTLVSLLIALDQSTAVLLLNGARGMQRRMNPQLLAPETAGR